MSDYRDFELGGEAHRVHQEQVSLDDGPLELTLGGSDALRVVDTNRDLDDAPTASRLNRAIGCFVIDPNDLDSGKNNGFKALRDGETIELGRSSTYDRFNFSDKVSRRHVRLHRDGREIIITDLDSTNGTFLLEAHEAEDALVATEPVTVSGEDSADVRKKEVLGPKNYQFAGETSPADYRSRPARDEDNEDAFFVDRDNPAFAVFDGMGGHEGSAAASAIAVESVQRSLREAPLTSPRPIAELSMREALEKAHEAIMNHGISGIGTTAIAVKVFETESGMPYAMVGSAGDSRAHLIRDGKIDQVTLDHAYMGLPEGRRRDIQETFSQAIDLSKLSREEYAMFKQRNMIGSCLGGNRGDTPNISISDFSLQPDDRILLTSDGIHDNLTNGEIEEAVADTDVETAVQNLMREARARSRDISHDRAKDDDMTAVMLAYSQ